MGTKSWVVGAKSFVEGNHWFTGGSVVRRVENQLLLHQSYRTCNGDLLDIFKKKKWKENVTEEKIPLLLLLNKNKQTKKGKTKQNKSLVSICNVGDQLWLGLVLNRSQASADLQRQVLLWNAGQKRSGKVMQ